MEEILRDSEKDQNNSPALREGSSEAGDGSPGQTNQPSLHLVLDPSTTGIVKVLPPQSYMAVCFFLQFQVNLKIEYKALGSFMAKPYWKIPWGLLSFYDKLRVVGWNEFSPD